MLVLAEVDLRGMMAETVAHERGDIGEKLRKSLVTPVTKLPPTVEDVAAKTALLLDCGETDTTSFVAWALGMETDGAPVKTRDFVHDMGASITNAVRQLVGLCFMLANSTAAPCPSIVRRTTHIVLGSEAHAVRVWYRSYGTVHHGPTEPVNCTSLTGPCSRR